MPYALQHLNKKIYSGNYSTVRQYLKLRLEQQFLSDSKCDECAALKARTQINAFG